MGPGPRQVRPEPGRRVTRRVTRTRSDSTNLKAGAPDAEEARGTRGTRRPSDSKGRALHRVAPAVTRETLRFLGLTRDRIEVMRYASRVGAAASIFAPAHPPSVMLRPANGPARIRQPRRRGAVHRAGCGGCSRHTGRRCPTPPLSPQSPATRMRRARACASPGRRPGGRPSDLGQLEGLVHGGRCRRRACLRARARAGVRAWVVAGVRMRGCVRRSR